MDEPVRPNFFTLALSDHELSWLRELAAGAGSRDPADHLRSLLSHAVYEAPDAALWRRVRLARALREAHEAARDLERRPAELAACGLAAPGVETLESWWRAAVAGLKGSEPYADQCPMR